MKQVENKEVRILVRVEPSAISRYDRVADAFYGGNRSLLIRRALEDLVTRREREIVESEPVQEGKVA